MSSTVLDISCGLHRASVLFEVHGLEGRFGVGTVGALGETRVRKVALFAALHELLVGRHFALKEECLKILRKWDRMQVRSIEQRKFSKTHIFLKSQRLGSSSSGSIASIRSASVSSTAACNQKAYQFLSDASSLSSLRFLSVPLSLTSRTDRWRWWHAPSAADSRSEACLGYRNQCEESQKEDEMHDSKSGFDPFAAVSFILFASFKTC